MSSRFSRCGRSGIKSSANWYAHTKVFCEGKPIGADTSMPNANPIPTWEEAYRRFSPLLFGALGRLAHTGFMVSPIDAQDLIHDFYLEVWLGLGKRFEPERGSLEAYVYVAFVQFARPRIVQLLRIQNHLSDPVLLEGLRSPDPGPEEHTESKLLKIALGDAIEDLPNALRELLLAYCDAGVSERELARDLGLSRYKLRERLIEALGRVVVLLPKPTGIAPLDWDVACEVWKEQRSLSEAAHVLGKTEHQTQVAYKKCVHALAQVLSQYRKFKRRKKMDSTTEHSARLIALFRAAIVSVGNDALIQRVRDQSADILAVIREAEGLGDEPLADLDPSTLDHRWVARVYEALAGTAEEVIAGEAGDLRSLFEARQADIRSIGVAFEGALLPGLPRELKGFARCFSQVTPVADTVRRALSKHLDVQASESAQHMVFFGVSPHMILTATNAVARLAGRMISRGLLKPDIPLLLSVEDAEVLNERQQFSFLLASSEVGRATECNDQLASAVLRWCVGVAQYKPLLFDGFESRPETRFGITMRFTGHEISDLLQRWGRTGTPPVRSTTPPTVPDGDHAEIDRSSSPLSDAR